MNPSPGADWPRPIGQPARIGIAGRFLALIGPQTEADEAALLLQFLVFFGNSAGSSPHFVIEAARHGVNLFAVIVGNTAKGRKGTSEAHVRRILERCDPDWVKERIFSGLSSGEGLIVQVRDPRTVIGRNGQPEVLPGSPDKRLLVVESEFSKALSVMARDGNTLSAVVREAWDGRTLQVMTRNDPERATEAHVSIIGHITITELNQKMRDCEAWNGFGNRILWVCSRRARELPFGGNVDERALDDLADSVKQALAHARKTTKLDITEAARQAWPKMYSRLSADRPGLVGALTGRAEAQVMRLAAMYALLDCKDTIDIDHLQAADAVWLYCEASAYHLFGTKVGDPIADRIRSELQQRSGGMSRNEIREQVFQKNKSSQEIFHALEALLKNHLVRKERVSRNGRPEERWFAFGVEPPTAAPPPDAGTR